MARISVPIGGFTHHIVVPIENEVVTSFSMGTCIGNFTFILYIGHIGYIINVYTITLKKSFFF